MKQSRSPAGWDEARVRRVLAHYEEQAEDEAVAEDEAAFEDQGHAAFEDQGHTSMEVPKDLVPAVRELIARHQIHEKAGA